jgi:hypothetical protein
MGWSAGTLQSSTRSGFVSARRWQSSHIVPLTSCSRSRSFAMNAGRHFGHPTELMIRCGSSTPQRVSSSITISNTSASTIGDSEPMTSAPICENWR